MQSCFTCGMPFVGEHANDIALTLPEGSVCIHDAEGGKLKSPEEIFEGGVVFFTEAAADGDRELGIRLTIKNMNSLPYWQAHQFALLSGIEATDEEFENAMTKM